MFGLSGSILNTIGLWSELSVSNTSAFSWKSIPRTRAMSRTSGTSCTLKKVGSADALTWVVSGRGMFTGNCCFCWLTCNLMPCICYLNSVQESMDFDFVPSGHEVSKAAGSLYAYFMFIIPSML